MHLVVIGYLLLQALYLLFVLHYACVLFTGLLLQLLYDILELPSDVIGALTGHLEVFVLLTLVEELFPEFLYLLVFTLQAGDESVLVLESLL